MRLRRRPELPGADKRCEFGQLLMNQAKSAGQEETEQQGREGPMLGEDGLAQPLNDQGEALGQIIKGLGAHGADYLYHGWGWQEKNPASVG